MAWLAPFASAVGWALPLSHSQAIHSVAQQTARELHRDGLGAAERHHTLSYTQTELLAKRSYEQGERLYRFQREYDEGIALREARRDMWEQRIAKTSTLMILNTLMFGCGFAVIVEGMPPERTPRGILALFSGCLGLSFCALFLSVVFGLILQWVIAVYRIDKPYRKYACGSTHPTITTYWRCHCQKLEKYSGWAFWVGTVALAVTAVLLLCVRFVLNYSSYIGMYVLLSECCLAVVLLGVGYRMFVYQNLTYEEERDDEDPKTVAQMAAAQAAEASRIEAMRMMHDHPHVFSSGALPVSVDDVGVEPLPTASHSGIGGHGPLDTAPVGAFNGGTLPIVSTLPPESASYFGSRLSDGGGSRRSPARRVGLSPPTSSPVEAASETSSGEPDHQIPVWRQALPLPVDPLPNSYA